MYEKIGYHAIYLEYQMCQDRSKKKWNPAALSQLVSVEDIGISNLTYIYVLCADSGNFTKVGLS